MTIAVGQILDKYELLEKVGQGGMAVVYRGLDRSLRRTVAVKILHHHLADHREARERFEREAHAVAKLRHENILEIFDFAGGTSDESYIVTEFIDGLTLKEFVSEHQPKYPEIGAMIAVQVCRALSHAHSLGILHRDVKPENIMIRNDGVVKLTDFGIAQMIDTQRLTVTGQLIGSPAYMSPEHLEGKPLDFRTDVFATGVVLYQLVVGELPFQGRNPHELLKRIADGTYKDPRQVNPLIGNELGRIINKAMAHDKEARYPDITEMLGALEQFLDKSGIKQCREELARYFAAPVPYEVALRERLLAELSRRGRELLATDQVAALDLFNRVLTIEPEHREVLTQLDKLSRQRRTMRLAALVGSILVLGGAAYGVRQIVREDGPPSGQARVTREHASRLPTPAGSSDHTSPVPGSAGTEKPPDVASPAAGTPDAAPQRAGAAQGRVPAPPGQGGKPSSPGPGPGQGAAAPPSSPPPDNGSTEPRAPALRSFTLNVWPLKSEYRIDEGTWIPMSESKVAIQVGPGTHTVEVRNPQCCQPTQRTIAADESPGAISFTLGYLPATVTPQCDKPGVRVQINQKPARLDHKTPIPISGGLGRQDVTVTFFGERTDEQQLQVRYNEHQVVTCMFD